MSDDENSQAEVVKEPEREPEGLKFFLSHANSYEGLALFKELWNKDKVREPEWAAHSFVGTIKKNEQNPKGGFQEAPQGITNFVSMERTKEFREQILACDVIIYDLMTNNYEEVDYVIKTLKTSNLTKEKRLILLSSVMTWVNTPPKFEEEKPEGEEEGEGEEGEGEAEEEEEEEEAEENAEEGEGEDDDDKPKQKKVLFYKESDYHLRVPHAKFQHLKTLETVAMSAVTTQPMLKVHVLCTGIRYGNGERIFYDHFQKAWIQSPIQLPILGKGDNLIPTIHTIDLARLVNRIVSDKPNHPYIFAIDRTKKPTQKRIVQAIANGMGTGQAASVEVDTSDPKQAFWRDFLTINLKMKTSSIFKDGQLTPEQEEEENAEELLNALKFNWHSEKGIIDNVSNLNTEFNNFRGLNPVKIFISGPPACGKSHYAKILANYYNIPHVQVDELIAQAFELGAKEEDENADSEDTLAADIKTVIEELRDAEVARIEEERPETDDEPEEIDRESLKIRLPDSILYRLLKIRLNENACKNRGYILDGYPRNYTDAQNIFLKPPKTVTNKDGEEEDWEEPELEEGEEKDWSPYLKDEDILPSSCIVLEGEDDFLINRVRELPEDQIADTHYNQVDMVRRLKSYRDANNSEIAEPSVQELFKQQGIQILKTRCDEPESDVLNSFKIYIERFEKPSNYMTFDQEEEVKRFEEVKQQKVALTEQEHARQKHEELLEKILKRQKELFTKTALEQIRDMHKDVLDAQSHPIRQYLMDNLVPFLTDGVLEVCKRTPDDPCDFLAEYLFKRSLDVPYPDPTTY